MSLKRGNREGRAQLSSRSSTSQRGRGSSGDRAGRCISAADVHRRRLADADRQVERDGTVTVEESNTFGWSSVHRGMQFDKGFLSPTS